MGRRTLLLAGAFGVGGTAAVLIGGQGTAAIPLYSTTVALDADGRPVLVPEGSADRVVPGTRVLAGTTATDALVAAEKAWLGPSEPWVRGLGPFADLARAALLDLRVLSGSLPAAVAGWSPQWRYAWPRDNAFIICALAELGYLEDAFSQLSALEVLLSGSTGWFPARVDPWSGRVPDSRPAQLDGFGWVLWAARTLLGAGAPLDRLREHAPLLVRATRGLLDSLGADALPTVSPDYWEVPETSLTLGTAAAARIGLEAAGIVLPVLGEGALGAVAIERGAELGRRIVEVYAPSYPRHPGRSDPCASVAFLGPPFVDAAVPGMRRALDAAVERMRRPGGGLAPGSGWRADGVSWTPETALVALSLAGDGRPGQARGWLGWLDDHRTAAGSLPEKVLADGSPAAVAPLSWTAATVLLALRRL